MATSEPNQHAEIMHSLGSDPEIEVMAIVYDGVGDRLLQEVSACRAAQFHHGTAGREVGEEVIELPLLVIINAC